MDAIAQLPCVVCSSRPVEIHHLLRGGRRIGHLSSIPLCAPHHRGGSEHPPFISRHPFKARFEKAYGTEGELLELTRQIVRDRKRIAA